MKRKTNSQFVQELKLINNSIIPEEPYINASTKILCRCAKCGYTWYATPNNLLGGSGCANCAGNIKKSNSQFIIELSRVNPSIEPLEEYQGKEKPILCRCKECGNEWKAKPKNLLKNKYSCYRCSLQQRGITRRKTNEVFVNELRQKKPYIIPLEQYSVSSKKIKCQCKKCGHIWAARPNNLLDNGSGCPNCNHSATSIIEQIIARALSITIGNSFVLSRDRKAIKKELDIYIPHLRLAIEFGAWFWHKDKLKNDNEKQRLCREKGIHLITIFEKCPEIINDQLIGDYRIYKTNLSAEKDYHSLKIIIKDIFDEYSITCSKIEAEWDTIVTESIASAQRRTKEDFIRMLHNINPSISLIGAYTKADERVNCKCEKCGYEWSALASSLLSGHGCPKCAISINAKKNTLTNKEFLSRLSTVNNCVEPLEPYKKSNISMLCKCKTCGNTWLIKPASLLGGRGCPKCARDRVTAFHSIPVRCVETGINYSSIAAARRETGVSKIHRCINGVQKTAGGYHWERIDDVDKE